MIRKSMSKNLTRKGLTLGALVALVSSVIAGVPAQAANELTVAPSSGTSYNIASGSVFNLATTFAPGYTPSSYAQLKYLVKTDANSAISYDVSRTAVVTNTSANSVAVSTTSTAIGATVTGATDVAYLGLSAVTTTDTSRVEVTAFVDANNDGALTAGEWNTVKTVTFLKASAITPTVTLTAPATGDTKVSATVVWGDLNIEQMSAETVKFTVGTQVASATAGTLASGVWTKDSLSALAAAEAVTAQAYDGSTALGTAATGAASARTINATNGLVANVLKGADAVATSATTMTTSTAATVRVNGTFTAQVKAYDTATTPAAAANVAVVGSVPTLGAGITLRAASTGVTEISITVAGTKYVSNDVLRAATFALKTDSTGVASLVVSSAGLTAGNTATITVKFAAQNLEAAVVATETAAAYTVTDDAASTVVATNKNTAVSFNYSVKDQFGVLSARTNERLLVSATQTGGAGIANQFITVAGGKAAFTVKPETDITGDIAVSAALQISTTSTTTGVTTWAADGIDVANRTVKFRSAAYSFTTAPAIDATAGINGGAWTETGAQKQTLTTVDQSDSTLTTGLVSPAAGTTWAKVTLTGSNAGESLTVSGTGVFLSIDGGTVAKDKATKTAEAAAVVIYVASNTAGAKTITVTNGTVSKTVVVTFDKAAATAGKTVAIGTLDSQAQAGRAVDVSATIVDKFGNAVAGATVTLSSTGVGYLANNSVTTTDVNGRVTAKLVVGSADLGTATITATSTLADATVATASKSVEFGITDADVTVGGRAVYASVEFAKGKTVTVTVDGKRLYSKLQSSDNYVELKFTQKKAGKHVVTVRVSGGVSVTETVVTTK
jgi:hypothetical protein